MTCHDCQILLQQLLDHETIADAAALEQHLAGCADCRVWQAAARQLDKGIRHLPRPEATPELTRRIVRAVLVERSMRRRRRLLAVSGLAASLVIAVLLGAYLLRPKARQQDLAVQTAPPSHPRTPETLEAPGPSLSLRDSVAEVAQLTLRKADETVGQARSLWPNAAPKEISPVPPPLTPPVDPLREAGSSVTAGLEPVADSARRAFHLFLREIPPVRTEDKRKS
jgi:hypothetical protein